jgi:hypothetical protein
MWGKVATEGKTIFYYIEEKSSQKINSQSNDDFP